MKRITLVLAGLVGLTACTDGQPLTFAQNPDVTRRAYAAAFQDQPFDTGAVSVVAEEHGDLHTYTLTPCRGGANVCGSRTGTYAVTPDFWVVSGAYRGRTFYLAPGGSGWIKRNGVLTTLAWN